MHQDQPGEGVLGKAGHLLEIAPQHLGQPGHDQVSSVFVLLPSLVELQQVPLQVVTWNLLRLVLLKLVLQKLWLVLLSVKVFKCFLSLRKSSHEMVWIK